MARLTLVRLANASRLLPCVALLMVSAPAARADQVHTDPNSPTSKEYAIPLATARHAAAPSGAGSHSGGSSSPSASGAAPLFGVGVGSSGSGASSATTKAKPKKHHSHRSTATKNQVHVTQSAPLTPPSHLTEATNTPGGGVTTPVLIGGLAAVALLLGGLGGLAVRRRTA